jgi:hypothetical protein
MLKCYFVKRVPARTGAWAATLETAVRIHQKRTEITQAKITDVELFNALCLKEVQNRSPQ